MSKAYRKGRSTEYRCREELRKMGVNLVFRSAGSRGPADLIAINPVRREIWLIQCKGGRPPPMARLEREYGVLRELEGEYRVLAYAYVKDKRAKRYEFVRLGA